VPQAQALDDLLKKKHMKLDAVVELRVNESALLARVESRVAEMMARGEEVRIDDTPEVLSKRLASYRSLTEPLIHYYSERRKLLTVDGMMTIEHVTREINRILAAIGAVDAKSANKAAGRAASRLPDKAAKAAKKAAKTPRRAGKPASKGTKKSALKARSAAKAGRRKSPKKSAKKVTKRRAKA
jgi:adenylate kinase